MSLINSYKFTSLLVRKNGFLYAAVRNHWNKDYKPAPFPTTKEARIAAAAKYGILPAEYEPYPDDGTGLGDYPKLPAISGESRDPYYPWDNPELKRNFNEPIHVHADLMGEDRYDVNSNPRVPKWLQLTQFFGVLFGLGAIMLYCENFKQFPGLIPKQLPESGKTHYTFEPN